MSGIAIIGDRAHALKCDLAAEVLRASGQVRLRVLGTSMLPALWPGDVVDIQAGPLQEMCLGEVAAFTRGGRIWAHRVIRNDGSSLTTRGDALALDDPPVLPDHLLGRVVSIYRGRTWIAPTETLTCMQTLLNFLIRRSGLFRCFILHLHALRLRLMRSPLQETACR